MGLSLDQKSEWRGHIDGLRAISVLGVLFYHAGYGGVQGGFVGVDVFFVISGFLISKIIYNDVEKHGRFRIAHFYERRIRRILPVFTIVTAASLLAGALLCLPDLFMLLATSALYACGFVANIFYYLTSDYFGPTAVTQPLLHYWSLGVEEQFYIFFPLLVIAVTRISARLLASTLVLIALSSLVLSELYLRSAPEAVFYLAPLRAWELLVGSILALPRVPFPNLRYAQEVIGATGLALIAYAILRFNDGTPFPGLNATVPVGGAALILWACERGTTSIGWILSQRPLRDIGLWSYSIYMIHWPLIVFGKILLPQVDASFPPVIVVLSIVLGWASYRYIETPTRNVEFLSSKTKLFSTSLGTLATLVVAASFIQVSGGFPSRLPENVLSTLAFNHYAYQEHFRTHTCFIGNQQADVDPTCLISDRPTILLWGDSHAAALYQALDERLGSIASISQANKSSCLPIVGWKTKAGPFCDIFNASIMGWIGKQKPKAVILTGFWTANRNYEAQLRATVARLRDSKIPVVIIGESPRFHDSVPNILAIRLMNGDHGFDAGQYLIQGEFENDIVMRDLFSGISGVTFISVYKTYCQDGKCPIADEKGIPLFWDKDHFTLEGARLAVARMFPNEMSTEKMLRHDSVSK